MRFFSLMIIFFFFLPSFSLAVVEFSEIMYDFPGDDNNHEYIEIFSEESLNYSGFIIRDLVSNDTLEQIYYYPGPYSLIVEEDFNYSRINASIYSVGKTIGNNLNDEDMIYLYDPNGILLDLAYYNSSFGAKGNNRSLEKNKAGKWEESLVEGGTPGRKNSVNDKLNNSDYGSKPSYSGLQINEIMVDPFGDDNSLQPLGEWVELYNSGNDFISLEGLVLYDSEDDHELYVTDINTISLLLCPKCYALIYRNGDSDFDLSKNHDKVRLFTGYPLSEHTLIDEVAYSNSLEGLTFSRFGLEWSLVKPTPGEKNVYTGGCDWELSLEMENSIFQKDNFEFKVAVKRNAGFSDNITVRGRIDNYFGETIKEYSPWTDTFIMTSKSKSYSPNLAEGVYQLTFKIEGLSCEDFNNQNNLITRLVAINPEYQKTENFLEIEKIYLGNDQQARWGDQLTVKANIYKGNDSRTSLQTWVEKDGQVVSKKSKLNTYEKYQYYTLTVPLQLYPNCAHEDSSDGQAKLILEGLGLRAEQEFLVEGINQEVCKDYSTYLKQKEREELNKNNNSNLAEGQPEEYQIINLPLEVCPGEIFKIRLQFFGDQERDFKVWSYLYRGNKCYSCTGGKERDNNLLDFHLKKNEIKIVEMLVQADNNITAGEYSLMIKLNKDSQKTNQSLSKKIQVKEKKEMEKDNSITEITSTLNDSLSAFNVLEEDTGSLRKDSLESRKKELLSQLTGMVIYESNSEKASKLIPLLLSITFALLTLAVIIKKS
ncbi:MAG: lamin tail domain-containing protein [Nanoarchaeota archaeon]|nr:lamin tail domain-containing protein [Nanoarchaeota archaeon]